MSDEMSAGTNIIINISPFKSGTTSLYCSLVRSKYVCEPALKEARFFADEEAEDFDGLPQAMRPVGNFKLGMEWHNQLFNEVGCKYRIDFSPSYAVSKNTPDLIKQYYPNPKLIFVVRDPVQRFVSHYYQYVKMGVKVPEIKEVISGDTDVGRYLFSFCDYQEIYQRYAAKFGEESICLIDFNDLVANRLAVEEKLRSFLDIDDFIYLPSEKEKNKAGFPKIEVIQNIMFSNFATTLGRALPPKLRRAGLWLRRKIRELNTTTMKYQELDKEVELELTKKLQDAFNFYQKVAAK